MISMLCGLPGSGKSTALAWLCKKALDGKDLYLCGQKIANGHKNIVTNFPFYGTYQFNVETLGHMHYTDTLFIIDESSMYFDSRDFKNFTAFLKEFFTQHRKDDIDVILCSQAYDDNDKKIRNLTANLFYCESFFFDIFRISHIEPFFEIINFQPVSGYRWGKFQFFWGRPIFKLFDSFAKINSSAVDPVCFVSWNVPVALPPVKPVDRLRNQLYGSLGKFSERIKNHGESKRQQNQKLEFHSVSGECSEKLEGNS